MLDDSQPLGAKMQLLAKVYELILSWPDPPDYKSTADPDDFGEQTGPAEEATKSEDLPRFDSTPKRGGRE